MKTKPCPVCGKDLELPEEYLDAVSKIRLEVEKFGSVIRRDFIEYELKEVFFELIRSHMQLSQAEYNRNPSYNNEHFSHKAEESVIKFLKKNQLLAEFMAEVKP